MPRFHNAVFRVVIPSCLSEFMLLSCGYFVPPCQARNVDWREVNIKIRDQDNVDFLRHFCTGIQGYLSRGFCVKCTTLRFFAVGVS